MKKNAGDAGFFIGAPRCTTISKIKGLIFYPLVKLVRNLGAPMKKPASPAFFFHKKVLTMSLNITTKFQYPADIISHINSHVNVCVTMRHLGNIKKIAFFS